MSQRQSTPQPIHESCARHPVEVRTQWGWARGISFGVAGGRIPVLLPDGAVVWFMPREVRRPTSAWTLT